MNVCLDKADDKRVITYEKWPERAFVLLVTALTVFLVIISVSGDKSVTLIKKTPKPILLGFLFLH